MELNDTLPIIFGLFAIFEGLQVYFMLRAVRGIQKRMDAVLPEDTKAGDIMAQGVISLMARIQANNGDNEDAKVVGGFVRTAALTAWDEVSSRIPGLGPATQTNEALEKLAHKNPWVGVAMGLAQTFGPMIAEKVQQGAQPGQTPRKGTGGRQYG